MVLYCRCTKPQDPDHTKLHFDAIPTLFICDVALPVFFFLLAEDHIPQCWLWGKTVSVVIGLRLCMFVWCTIAFLFKTGTWWFELSCPPDAELFLDWYIEYMGHSMSYGNFSFGQKYGNTGSGVCVCERERERENMWHDLVKVTIRRWCTHRSAQAFRVPTLLYWQSCSEIFGVKWHKLAHQKMMMMMMMMMMVFATFLIAANKPWTPSGTT